MKYIDEYRQLSNMAAYKDQSFLPNCGLSLEYEGWLLLLTRCTTIDGFCGQQKK